MKSRYIIALILTVLLLVVARKTSTRNQDNFTAESGGVTLTHRTVTESFGQVPRLDVVSNQTDVVRAIVLFSETAGGPYQSLEMNSTPDGFSAELPNLDRGKRWYYHIDVYKDNIKLATFPPDRDQFIKFKGNVSPLILIPHILLMFATIFFGVMTVFTAFDLSRGRGDAKRSVRFLLLTLVSAFLGGIPFGIAVTFQTFGEGWGGWPIGRDFTDTKTEIFLLFWFISFILAARGLKDGKLSISTKVYTTLVVISFAVTLITFLIPHSI